MVTRTGKQTRIHKNRWQEQVNKHAYTRTNILEIVRHNQRRINGQSPIPVMSIDININTLDNNVMIIYNNKNKAISKVTIKIYINESKTYILCRIEPN